MIKFTLLERKRHMKIAHVYVEHPILHLDHTFTYRYDSFSLTRGIRVRVPFGNTSIVGFVRDVEDCSEDTLKQYPYTLKWIQDVIDMEPLINEELFLLANWMAQTCVAPLISCFQCMLPAKLKPKSSAGRIKMEAWVRVVKEYDTLTKKQEEAYQSLLKEKEMLRSQFYQLYKAPGKKLIQAGFVEVFEKQVRARLKHIDPILEASITLRPEQKEAIHTMQKEKHHSVFLLHGATGSGKTEVFLQLAKQVIDKGQQVVLLVPEISLTPQMIQRVISRFGSDVAIYHSGLNAQEMYEQYQLVKQHKVQIVVGTRSAIFMPFHKLGLIIMDEEHDTSYKQDASPRYHCRDIAIHRGKYHDALVLLASATPSLESYARAHKSVYQLIEMPNRARGCFPSIKLVEMRKAVAQGESYILSNEVLNAIHDRLQKKEQIILLLNRRGYTSVLRCIGCGYVQLCPHCDVSMSYHKEDHVLKCHTCGCSMQLPKQCPTCNCATWRYLGLGTQKLEELVQQTFPQARLLRMDADTTSKKNAHEQLLHAFKEHQADILLGTQMIAKGLDFENVTLVGIINGDAMLQRSDYRSAELTYDLLEQASGRSGRGSKQGEVIIQTYDTSHYAITCALHHDYNNFFKNEMNYRHLAGYPPYMYLASIVFVHKKQEVVDKASKHAMQVLGKMVDVKILGPAILHKIQDELRTRILLKGKRQEVLTSYVRFVYEEHQKTKQKARMEIDLVPLILE